MLKVGLTGGIGSGKSSVSSRLRDLGAFLIDSDVSAREVVAPGTPGLAAITREFGEAVLQPDGSLDRPALGGIVFGDPERLAALNAIVHPLVIERTAELMAQAEREGARVVVHDVPLLVENGMTGNYDEVVVVAASPHTQLDRLVRLRGMSREDAQARIDAQKPLADKVALATHVIDNDGDLDRLWPQVDALWALLSTAAAQG